MAQAQTTRERKRDRKREKERTRELPEEGFWRDLEEITSHARPMVLVAHGPPPKLEG